jgi:hypothetical protein
MRLPDGKIEVYDQLNNLIAHDRGSDEKILNRAHNNYNDFE